MPVIWIVNYLNHSQYKTVTMYFPITGLGKIQYYFKNINFSQFTFHVPTVQ